MPKIWKKRATGIAISFTGFERERGLDFQEDLFNPLVFRWNLSQPSTAIVIAATEPYDISTADKLRKGAERRELLRASAPSG